MPTAKWLGTVALLVAALRTVSGAGEAEIPVLYQDDFSKDGALAKWEPTDAAQWKIGTDGDNKVLSLHEKKSAYKTKFRSPFSFALLRDVCVGDFVLDLKAKSTVKPYGHQDLCFFFGYQDPTHFYYAHLAVAADPNAHSVMIVNEAPRVSLLGEPGKDVGGEAFRTKGVVWGEAWHHIRIVRKVGDGLIEVYFDDMAAPVMRVRDKTLAWGRVGVGSFDDTGDFDDVILRGVKVEPGKRE
ncbi:MAG TPA: hypothetical protein PLE19_17360 [Planctomycetota bacterium]|nr:hypothetical protein [Planctomycetota bacterium]HRR80325.1 hypothetical protein [Planctomycetota bacterium]HRT94131.1 hypothetical protein [Planctomycetota bacterium]